MAASSSSRSVMSNIIVVLCLTTLVFLNALSFSEAARIEFLDSQEMNAPTPAPTPVAGDDVFQEMKSNSQREWNLKMCTCCVLTVGHVHSCCHLCHPIFPPPPKAPTPSTPIPAPATATRPPPTLASATATPLPTPSTPVPTPAPDTANPLLAKAPTPSTPIPAPAPAPGIV